MALRALVTGVMIGLLTLPAAAAIYNPTHVTLQNGLDVVVVPNHRAPVVHVMVWYRVGSIDEEPGLSGLAHYLEHLMFKGTSTVPGGGYSRRVAEVGGSENAFTSYDYTAYYATVPATFLPEQLRLEADRMQNLLLREDDAEPELDVVLAERRQRLEDNAIGRFSEKFFRKVYGDHAYGRPVIGWRPEVEKLSAKAARDFYHTWYVPNNALVVISGDVTSEEAVRQVEAAFGAIPSRALPNRALPGKAYHARKDPEQILVQDRDTEQTTIERHYAAPIWTAAKGNRAYALEVLAQILDGGAVGRLYRSLVVQQKLATEANANYDGDARALGRFTLTLALPTRGNVGTAIAALDKLLLRIAKSGVQPSEVDLAISRLKREARLARDGLTTPGQVFGRALMVGETVEEIEEWPDRISQVTVKDVNAAARALLTSKDVVTGILVPDHAAQDGRDGPNRPFSSSSTEIR